MRFPSNYATCEDYFKVPNGRSDTTKSPTVARAEGLLVCRFLDAGNNESLSALS